MLSRPARTRTWTGEVGARRAPALHHGPRERTTRIERAPPEWRSGALPAELRPPNSTPGWSRTSGRCRRRAALSPLSYGRRKSLRQESNPHLGRTKGACLPLTLRRRRWRRRESNPLLLGASEALCHQSFIPKVRTGGVEPPQREAAGLQPAELTDAQRPHRGVADRTRTGTARLTTSDARRLHHGHHEEEAGTTGFEPATSRLTSERSAQLSYAPERGSAGGIRTHDLKLMRLARTAAPLPRKSGWQESNLRSPAPEAGGVASSPTARRRTIEAPAAGFEPASRD
jgi:hypothetical protein